MELNKIIITEKYVEKIFTWKSTFFKILSAIITPYPYKDNFSPKSRFKNEIIMNKKISCFIDAPNIIQVLHKDKRIIYEYLDKPKKSSDFFIECGIITAKMHKKGFFINDNKPQNYLSKKKKIVIIDLEHTSKNGNKLWDICLFLYHTPKEEKNSFLEGYSSINPVDIDLINKKLKSLEKYRFFTKRIE